MTSSETVGTLCRRLLLSSLVTELRSAVNAPTTGAVVRENSDLVRAHLASLLREVGLDSEARAVAKAALPGLKKMEVRPFEDHRARHFLRANARVLEGLGDDRGAAQAYQKFIRFGAQLKADKNCLRCHDGMIAPKEMAWFRDFWAGEKFARYEALGSSLEKAIGRHRRALESSPDDTGRQMMLGYLYKAKGDQEQAMNMWALVEGKAELAAAQKED